MIDSLNRFNIF